MGKEEEMEHAFVQVYPQGRIVTKVPAKNASPKRYNRSRLKQELRRKFVTTDEDGTVVWFRWDGGGSVTIALDFPRDRHSRRYLLKITKQLEELLSELELIDRFEICEMHRSLYH